MLSRPALLLRVEEAVLLVLTILLYRDLHLSWILFAVLFFAPDLFMLGYLAGPRAGSALYNVGHVLFIPVLLFLFGLATHRQTMMAVALIWLAHIFFDRLLGYGLKYPTFFKDTHLNRIG